MSPEAPLVSVIVCVYNAGPFLRASVQSLLAQTHRNIEIIIIDDGSTDGCIKNIEDLMDERVRIITQPNRGKPAAMNVAIEAARGEFYVIQDADDLSDSTRVERQLQCLRDNPAAAAVFCGHRVILDHQELAPTFLGKGIDECREDIGNFRMPAHDPTAMYRMEMVRELRYDPALRMAEGLDYILRVGEKFPMLVLGECLYSYRVHRDSLTARTPQVRIRYVRDVLRRACQRRGDDFISRFGEDSDRHAGQPRELDNGLATHFIESACDLKRAGRRWDALRVGFACSRLRPLVSHYHKALIYAALPAWLVTASRRQAGS